MKRKTQRSTASSSPRRPRGRPGLFLPPQNILTLCFRQYLISDPATSHAVLVDTVLDYDPASGKVSTESADKLLAFIEKKNLKILRILWVTTFS